MKRNRQVDPRITCTAALEELFRLCRIQSCRGCLDAVWCQLNKGTQCSIKCVNNSSHLMYTIVQHHCENGKQVCKSNDLKRTLNRTGRWKIDGTLKELHVNRQTIPLWHNLGPWGWVRPKQTSSLELRSWRLAAPSMTMRMGHRPHQEAKGTRRTKTSVHIRLSDRRCTERCLLFARTPKRRVMKTENNPDEDKDTDQRWTVSNRLWLKLNWLISWILSVQPCNYNCSKSCMEICNISKQCLILKVKIRAKYNKCNNTWHLSL